jgi:glyoxylase-like metal-dependent hydrolase (beta-lactamase superfamily II)
MDVRRVADGLWIWTAPHPNWRNWPGYPDEPEAVGCVYYEADDAVVLIDPLLPRGEEEEFLEHFDRDVERLGLPVVILLSCHWHRRSSAELAERYRARIGGELPDGIEELPIEGSRERQVAYFIRPHRALFVAEVFAGEGSGRLSLRPSPALIDRAALDRSLQSLLDLPVERLLVSHGEPILEDARRRMQEALSGC